MKNKIYYEDWTIENFINALELPVKYAITGYSYLKPIKTKEDLKEFLKNNQPYYKKHIPEVYNHFKQKYKL